MIGPWVLIHFDPNADEFRGRSYEGGFYRSKERAQEIADRCNTKLLSNKHAESRRHFDAGYRNWKEWTVLFDAGLRGTPPKAEPVHVDEPLRTFANKPADAKYGWPEEHYYVEEMVFEDE